MNDLHNLSKSYFWDYGDAYHLLNLNTNAFALKTIGFLLKNLSNRKMNSNYLLLFDLSVPNALGFLSSKYKCYSKTQTRSFSMLHEARPKRFNLNSISKTVNTLELNLGFWEVVTKRERERERERDAKIITIHLA